MNQPYVAPALYVTWQEPESRAIFVVGRLIRLALDTEELEFAYTEGSRRAEAVGFKGFLSFPGLEQVFRCSALPPFFSNRVMTPRRPDFPQYLKELGLTVKDAAPLAILSRSGGGAKRIPTRFLPS